LLNSANLYFSHESKFENLHSLNNESGLRRNSDNLYDSSGLKKCVNLAVSCFPEGVLGIILRSAQDDGVFFVRHPSLRSGWPGAFVILSGAKDLNTIHAKPYSHRSKSEFSQDV
jgi:hypothetical protein